MPPSKRQWFTLDAVWVSAALAFIALRALLTPAPPHDLWWHMATGRLIMATGAIPTTDSFSFTQAGEPFYNQSWLAQLLLYGLHQAGGLPLLIVVQAGMLAATYGLLLWLCVQRTGAVRLSAGFVLVLTMPASFDNWSIRPQTYALPLFVSFVVILSLWRGGARRLLWILPLLAVIWVNLHGSFVLGGALIALAFGGELVQRWRVTRGQVTLPAGSPPIRDLVLVGIAVGVAWLINPGGWGVLAYVRNLLSSSPVTQLVTEWAPMTIRDPYGAIFFLFVIIGVGILAYARQSPHPTEMLWAAAFFWLALSAVRNNIWFVAAVTPLLVVQAQRLLPERSEEPAQGVALLNGTIMALFALMLLICLPWLRPVLGLPAPFDRLTTPETPVAAVVALQQDPERPQRLFHALPFGSYLIWAAPEQPVWIDPRIELYPLTQWQAYLALSAGEQVDALLTRYAIDGMLIDPTSQSGLLAYVEANPALWEVRYADADTVYALRR
jgi:hypothetical protein